MTVDTFEPDLLNLLYPEQARAEGFKPYYVYKWERDGLSSIIRHYPPARQTYSQYHAPSDAPSSIGFRGVMVKSYDTPMVQQQEVKLCWVGLDIDKEHNESVIRELRLGTLADYIQTLLSAVPAVVRCSKSGHGAHVLVPLADMEAMPMIRCKAIAQQVASKFQALLGDHGIETCVTGLPNMWLYTRGGAQRTLSLTNDLYHVTPDELQAPAAYSAPEVQALSVGRFEGLASRVVNQLVADGVLHPDLPGRTQVNIGRVRRSLAKIGIEFNTKSKCRVEHEHEPNGYIELTGDGTVRVVSNADDNSVVLTLVSA